MKTLKYRSIFTGITAVAMSVFLFTACEKDTDAELVSAPQGDRLEKFSRLTFSGTTSSTNSGSGTFIGNSGSFNFTSADGGGLSFAEAGASSNAFSNIESGNVFTDPMSFGPSFGISGNLGLGGGTATFNGESRDFLFGYCASQPIGGNTTLPDTVSDVNIFVGIIGDWQDPDASDVSFLYVISYDGSSTIGDFGSYSEYDPSVDDLESYVILVNFEDDNGTTVQKTWFGTEGDINFGENTVDITNATLVEVLNGDLNTSNTADFSANIECVSYNESEDM